MMVNDTKLEDLSLDVNLIIRLKEQLAEQKARADLLSKQNDTLQLHLTEMNAKLEKVREQLDNLITHINNEDLEITKEHLKIIKKGCE